MTQVQEEAAMLWLLEAYTRARALESNSMPVVLLRRRLHVLIDHRATMPGRRWLSLYRRQLLGVVRTVEERHPDLMAGYPLGLLAGADLPPGLQRVVSIEPPPAGAEAVGRMVQAPGARRGVMQAVIARSRGRSAVQGLVEAPASGLSARGVGAVAEEPKLAEPCPEPRFTASGIHVGVTYPGREGADPLMVLLRDIQALVVTAGTRCVRLPSGVADLDAVLSASLDLQSAVQAAIDARTALPTGGVELRLRGAGVPP